MQGPVEIVDISPNLFGLIWAMEGREKIKLVFVTLLITLANDRFTAKENLAKGLIFTAKEAQSVLKSCCASQEICGVEQKIRIKIPNSKSMAVLKTLMTLRLVYPATEIIMTTLTPNTRLKPTAKGLAILHDHCMKNAMLTGPVCQLLHSLNNTMHLLELPRDSSGQLKISTGLVITLWQQTMGSKPCVYKPDRTAPSVEAPEFYKVSGKLAEKFSEFDKPTPSAGPSPYYNRFFCHPNSNAVSQYWESKSGVRLLGNIRFKVPANRTGKGKSKKITRDLCVPGKALWQWIMECTDTLNFKEAVAIVALFASNEFISPIGDEVVEAVCFGDEMPVLVSRATLYDITSKGRWVSLWKYHGQASIGPVISGEPNVCPAQLSEKLNSSETAKLAEYLDIYYALQDSRTELSDIASPNLVLSEPGLAMLFKQWLREQHTVEPLLFLNDYQELKRALNDFWDGLDVPQLASHCWQLICKLVLQYLGNGAPIELNLSSEEREEVLKMFPTVYTLTTESLSKCAKAMESGLESIAKKQHRIIEHLATQFVTTVQISPALEQYVVKEQLYYAVNVLAAEELVDVKADSSVSV